MNARKHYQLAAIYRGKTFANEKQGIKRFLINIVHAMSGNLGVSIRLINQAIR